MWTKIKWGLAVLAVVIVGLFLHDTLPQRDVVQIINTYNKNTPIGGNWMFYSIEDTGTGVETTATIRDIRFIDAVFPDGQHVMVYRNEDTGWFWQTKGMGCAVKTGALLQGAVTVFSSASA